MEEKKGEGSAKSEEQLRIEDFNARCEKFRPELDALLDKYDIELGGRMNRADIGTFAVPTFVDRKTAAKKA